MIKNAKTCLLIAFISLFLFMYACVLAAANCESQRTTFRSWFSFHYRGPRDGTQVLRFGSRYLYPLSHLTGLHYVFWCCLNLDMCLNACVWFCLAIFFCVGCNRAVCTFWVWSFLCYLTDMLLSDSSMLFVCWGSLFFFLYNFPVCGYTTIYLKDWSCLMIGSSGLNMLYSSR